MAVWILRLLLLLLLLYLAATLSLYLWQRHLLYHPSHSTAAREGFSLGEGNEKIWIETRHPGHPCALLYFPGNSEDYWDFPDELARHLPECTLYFLHYRGYGASAGHPSEAAFFADALRLYDYVAPRHRQIVAFGRSLGSGIALYLASRRSLDALILTTPYDSVLNVGKEHYPLFPVSLLLKDRFDSRRYAATVQAPTLVLLAGKDRIISRRRSEALLHAFKWIRPRVVDIPEAGHGDIVEAPAYFPAIRDFLDRTISTRNPGSE
ncbi:hypothetical protein [Nitratifractor sp.]|uniref:alpha/beta hydrolase n=1 Tax=Nitratifractor sp. TaxID=2268144 RepID=UPI0025EB4A87|nr:hypothetical protein [Nitratifractor sp.]